MPEPMSELMCNCPASRITSIIRHTLSLFGTLILLCSAVHAKPPAKVAPLPASASWLTHVQKDLMPFWDTPDAYGQPRGNFPTFRCNDGKLFEAQTHPCAEIGNAPDWIKASLKRRYVRMQARQTYVYASAFHLTGNPEMLKLAQDGVQYLRTHALDAASGSATSYWEDGQAQPAVLARTTQDLAYAQLGMAMVYYLTRDPAILADILRLKQHIFSQYYQADWGMLMWVKQDHGDGEAKRQELVAQLDQINAYMLLLTPLLPEPEQAQWRQELRQLAYLMIEKFHAPQHHLMWGSLHNPAERVLGSRHTDFGHTIKAYWMIHQIGKLSADPTLIHFAKTESAFVLEQAFIPATGSWGSRLRRNGSVDQGKEWWIYAELDQMAATLALDDPGFTRYLNKTYRFWLDKMVDHQQHEVFGWVSPEGESAPGPKIHFWKNGYHSMEHALVAYITTQALQGKNVNLYFAFKNMPGKDKIRPYVFEGVVNKQQFMPKSPGLRPVKISFKLTTSNNLKP